MATYRPRSMSERFRLTPLLLALAGCTCGPCAPGKGTATGPSAADFTALLKELPRATVSRPSALVSNFIFTQSHSPGLVFATSDAKGSWDALIATDLGKALVQGGAIDHLKLSGQLEAALSVSHEIASSSKYPIATDRLAEALTGPAAVAVSSAEPPQFVAVKEIDPSQEAVVRLALMAASLQSDNVTVEDHQGQKISKIHRGGRDVFVVAFQNVVIAASSLHLAADAVDLAMGKSTDSVESTAAFKEEASTLKGAQAALLLNLEPDAAGAIVTDVHALVLRVELAPAVIKVRGTLNSEPSQVAAFKALGTVPQEVAFFTSLGSASPDEMIKRLDDSAQAGGALQIPASMIAALSGESFYALAGVEGKRFTHLAGLGLKDSAAAAKALPKAAKTWIDGAVPKKFGDSVTGFCRSKGGLCVAVTKEFLLVSTQEQALQQAVETGLGKHPSLADVKGFSQIAKAGEPRYLTTYLNTARASQVALAFFTAVAEHQSQRFDVGDVDDTVGPLCKALAGLPPLGGALSATGDAIAGELRPLPAQ